MVTLTILFFNSFLIFIQPAASTLSSRAVIFNIQACGVVNLVSFISRFLENGVRSTLRRTERNTGFEKIFGI